MKKCMMLSLLAGLCFSCSPKKKETPSMEESRSFRFLVDEFADLKVMRFQIPNWDSLTLQQKTFLYYLGEAAKCGRDILWDQNFKHNLLIRKSIENILSTYSGDTSSVEYKQFLQYAKRVFFSNGIHHHYSDEKFIPEFPKSYLSELIQKSDKNSFPIENKESIGLLTHFLEEILFQPDLYRTKKSNDSSSDLLLGSASNFYEGVSKQEALSFYKKMENPKDTTPISYGLNSKLIKENGKLREEVYKLGGLYSEAIEKVIFYLEKALPYAENESQKNFTTLLIAYYQTGDLHQWDAYNIAWVQDSLSTTDYVNGFIENYGDPLGIKATWESLVNFKDLEASRITTLISNNAQWFEDHSPIDPTFRKKEVKGVSAKSIIATTLGGDCFPTPPIGVNLPNADWIRKDYGSKSVSITNLMNAYDRAAEESPKSVTEEFCYSKEEVDLNKKFGSTGNLLHTDLHECLGHGSGQLLPGTSPNALAENSSSLEEARADLFALYYCADPKMLELGILPSLDVARAEYNSYIRNGLLVQLARIEEGKDITQAHMQARKLIASWCYEKGKEENVIEMKKKEGKTYFVINDHSKLRILFGKLLNEIQRIKSEGDYKEGKRLITKYAMKIDPMLHQEVRERYAALNTKPYGGFMNPELVPVEKNGEIVDVKIEYPSDFIAQHLLYGRKYSFLNATFKADILKKVK